MKTHILFTLFLLFTLQVAIVAEEPQKVSGISSSSTRPVFLNRMIEMQIEAEPLCTLLNNITVGKTISYMNEVSTKQIQTNKTVRERHYQDFRVFENKNCDHRVYGRVPTNGGCQKGYNQYGFIFWDYRGYSYQMISLPNRKTELRVWKGKECNGDGVAWHVDDYICYGRQDGAPSLVLYDERGPSELFYTLLIDYRFTIRNLYLEAQKCHQYTWIVLPYLRGAWISSYQITPTNLAVTIFLKDGRTIEKREHQWTGDADYGSEIITIRFCNRNTLLPTTINAAFHDD